MNTATVRSSGTYRNHSPHGKGYIMSVREKPTVLMARLADVEGEIADMKARQTMCRDQETQEAMDRLHAKRAAIQRDLNSKHGRQA